MKLPKFGSKFRVFRTFSDDGEDSLRTFLCIPPLHDMEGTTRVLALLKENHVLKRECPEEW